MTTAAVWSQKMSIKNNYFLRTFSQLTTRRRIYNDRAINTGTDPRQSMRKRPVYRRV